MNDISRFLILTIREDCKIHKYKYAEYWEEGYEYVDARFLYLGSNKYTSLRYIELFSYKLFYINMGLGKNITEDDVFDVINSIMTNKIDRGIPLYVRDIDVYKKVSEVYNNLDKVKDWKTIVTSKKPSEMDLKDKIIPKKKILFKRDIRGLISMNKKETKEYNSILDIREKEDYKFKLVRMKKSKYAIGIYNKHKHSENRDKINEAIEILPEDQEKITKKQICEFTGLSMSTVREHVNRLFDNIDKFPEVNVIVNQKQINKENTIETLRNSIESIKEKGSKVTKMSLHRESGISRVTIDKYWDSLKV